MIYIARYQSPVGLLTMAGDGENLTGLWIEGQKFYPEGLQAPKEDVICREELPVFIRAGEWLDRYFAGEAPKMEGLSLKPEGSVFRKSVWKLLCQIPYGETVTYGMLAKEMARLTGREKMSAQAIGGAVGHNPISIMIPCHRVVGSDGSLTGYAGGLELKARLLAHEAATGKKLQEKDW